MESLPAAFGLSIFTVEEKCKVCIVTGTWNGGDRVITHSHTVFPPSCVERIDRRLMERMESVCSVLSREERLKSEHV